MIRSVLIFRLWGLEQFRPPPHLHIGRVSFRLPELRPLNQKCRSTPYPSFYTPRPPHDDILGKMSVDFKICPYLGYRLRTIFRPLPHLCTVRGKSLPILKLNKFLFKLSINSRKF